MSNEDRSAEQRKERARVLELQTRLNVAVARRDTKALINALMRELALASGRPCPKGYER
jgi:hypothetical protein